VPHPRPETPARRHRRRLRRARFRLRQARRDLFLVDLDAFYVSVEQARDPALKGRPVIVGGAPGERGVVACASYEARAHGARAGMPLFQAAALCPRDTVFLHGDHGAYMKASRQVMAILGRFTPQVEPLSLDEAYLDLTGCDRHHRSWLDAGLTIQRTVADETGLAVSVGIAGTRAVANIATSLAKPGGVMEVKRGEEEAFLAALPLEYLPGVGPRMRQQLARFNLHTIGDLAQIPREVLEESFGRVGAAFHRRARGLEAPEDEVAVGQTRPKTHSISRETSFARDTADKRFIDAMVSYLTQRAARALRAEGSVARSVGVKLRYADFKTVEIRRRLAHPTDRDADILATAQALWRQRYDRRVKLRLVGVVLHDVEPAGELQMELDLRGSIATDVFKGGASDPLLPASPHAMSPRHGASALYDRAVRRLSGPLERRLDRTLDGVRDRYGFGAVVRGRAVDLLQRLPRSKAGFRLHTPSCSR
jgi:DNA polymerase-4